MSQDAVAVVEAAMEVVARDPFRAIDEYWADDVDHRAIESAVDDRGPIRGKEEFRAYLRDWLEMFDDLSIEPVELIDTGEDTVIAVLRASGRAKLSGVETEVTYACLYTIRDGKIARGREFWTREEALDGPGSCPESMRRTHRTTRCALAGLLAGVVVVGGCGGSDQAQESNRARQGSPGTLAGALALVRSEGAVCRILSREVLRNTYTLTGAKGRRICRSAYERLQPSPVSRVRVLSNRNGRARVLVGSAGGRAGVMVLERIDGRWLVTDLPGVEE